MSRIRMSTCSAPRRRSKLLLVIVPLAHIVAAGAAAGIYFGPRFESTAPQITLSSNAETAGVAPLQISITDRGTGLKAFRPRCRKAAPSIGSVPSSSRRHGTVAFAGDLRIDGNAIILDHGRRGP
jgi:hypothetical protein